MLQYEVIESKVWIHAITGRTASIYGASPWFYLADRPNWSIVSRGWTVRDNVNGTVGIGRPPWANRDVAQAWADAENERLTRLRPVHGRALHHHHPRAPHLESEGSLT